jgi:hypothetical protein
MSAYRASPLLLVIIRLGRTQYLNVLVEFDKLVKLIYRRRKRHQDPA